MKLPDKKENGKQAKAPRELADMTWAWMLLLLLLALIAMWVVLTGGGWTVVGVILAAFVVFGYVVVGVLLMDYYTCKGSARFMGSVWLATIIILVVLLVPFGFHAKRVLMDIEGDNKPPVRTRIVQQYDTKQDYVLEIRKLMVKHRVQYFAQVYHRSLGLAVVDKESGLYDTEAEATAHGEAMRDALIAEHAEYQRQREVFLNGGVSKTLRTGQYREFNPQKDAHRQRVVHQIHYLDRETVLVLQDGSCGYWPYHVFIYRWRKNRWRYANREWWCFKNIYEAQVRFDLMVRGTKVEPLDRTP